MEHRPNRPSWDCGACGKDWPCDPAREELAAEYRDGVQLAMVAWDYLEAFCHDQPAGPVGEMFDRFIAWTRRQPIPVDGSQ